MSDLKTYQGGCHCGNVRYRVQMELGPVMTCNCSICSKTGTMLAFVPVDQFELSQGEDALTDYQFNKNVIHHYFCKTCGIRSFARGTVPGSGKEMAAVNVRCLDDIDLDALQIQQVDGKSY